MVLEIIFEIRKSGKPPSPNMVAKLNMMNAYDRVKWLYLTKVLRKLGFSKTIIDIVYRLMGNN